MPISAAKMKANHKYDAKTYDKVTIRVKKQDMQRLRDVLGGQSINGFIVSAILEAIARLEAVNKK